MEDFNPADLSERELLVKIYTNQIDDRKRLESHGKRIASLEAWRNIILGGAAVVAAGWKLAVKALEKNGG